MSEIYFMSKITGLSYGQCILVDIAIVGGICILAFLPLIIYKLSNKKHKNKNKEKEK